MPYSISPAMPFLKKKRLFHAVGRHLQVVDQLGVLVQ